MTRPVRSAALVAATLASLALAACGSDGDARGPATTVSSTSTTTTAPSSTATTVATTPAPTTTTTVAGTVISITVTGGSVDGPGRQRVALGEEVTLRVTSDRADEVHVHTYDLHADVGPDAPAEIVFEATIPGVIEVELEESGRKLLDLEVSP